MNSKTQSTKIELSKSKIVLLTLGSFGFVSAGVLMWTIGGDILSGDTLFTKIIGLAAIVFFGMTGIYGIVKLFDNKPGLIINEEGILDNSSAIAGHLIVWTDITGFDIRQVRSTRFLLTYVNNPHDYIDKANYLKRFWMRMNEKIYGTPFSISSNSLQCNFDELIEIIERKMQKHGTQQDV